MRKSKRKKYYSPFYGDIESDEEYHEQLVIGSDDCSDEHVVDVDGAPEPIAKKENLDKKILQKKF